MLSTPPPPPAASAPQRRAPTAAVCPLDLPEDQFLLECLINASIRHEIAHSEVVAARDARSERRAGIAIALRSAAYLHLESVWRDYRYLGERLASLQQAQVAA